MPTTHHLAQLNIGRIRAPMDDPMIKPFVDALDEINLVADAAPGFVWRLSAEVDGLYQATGQADDRLVLNLSVWESYDALHAFVYRTAHGTFLRRRTEWFERWDGPSTVLWWVPAGTVVTEDAALARLRHLQDHGPTPQAFSLLHQYDADGHRIRRRR